MNAVRLIPNYTYEDYLLWKGRWEIIEGIPFAMSPSPTLKHQWVTANIIGEFRNAIKESNCNDCRVYDFIDIRINDNTIVQPDCSIVCGSVEGDFLDSAPVLAVEVLSKATALKDRHSKFSIYEKFGIKYYLIVEPEKQEVEIYLLSDNTYSLQSSPLHKSFKFQLDERCEISVDPRNFWE